MLTIAGMKVKLCRRTRLRTFAFVVCLLFVCVQIYNVYTLNLQSVDEAPAGHSMQEVGGIVNNSWSRVSMTKGNDSVFENMCSVPLSTDAVDTIERASSTACKLELAEVACLHQQRALYPLSLPRYCPLQSNNSGEYVGCFRDSKKIRIFKDFLTESNEHNSATACINHCLRAGFDLAGVQYRYECWCGSAMVSHSIRLSEERCNSPCPGSPMNVCGGYLAMGVYRTGFGVKITNHADYVPPSAMSSEHASPTYSGARIVFVLTVTGRALRQVTRLLRALYRSHHYYYIHVDSRQDYLHGELTHIAERFSNVRMATKRHATIWGGASLLTMLLDCMEELLTMKDWHWDYFLNLSESDYPIKTVKELEAFLTSNKGKNFVKSHGKDTPRFIRKQGLNMLFHECDNHLWRLGPRQLQDGIRIDGGSDWICLHRGFVRYVIGDNSSLVTGLKAYWKYSLLPAESFFHTVLQNSIYCQSVVNNNLHVTNWNRKQGCKCQYKHIVDWCGCSPNDLLPRDFNKLKNLRSRPMYFARKFEAVVNQEIINQIDELVYGFVLPPETPGLSSFWLNDYHHEYHPSSSPSVALLFYKAFASLAVQSLNVASSSCRLSFARLLEATTFMDNDTFSGLVLTVEMSAKGRRKQAITTEVLMKPSFGFLSVRVESEALERLSQIEVGTDFDPKEELFRNFAGLFGAESAIAVKLTWLPGPPVSSIALVVVFPNGSLTTNPVDVSVAEDTAIIAVHKLNIKQPLAAGIWTVHLVPDKTLQDHAADSIAQVRFLVMHGDESLAGDIRTDGNAVLESALSVAWRVVGNCVFVTADYLNSSDCRPQTSSCTQTPWSTKYPDPKSWLGQGQRRSSYIKRVDR